MSWRNEVLDPATMSTADIGAELRYDLDVYDQAQHPLSRQAIAARIKTLVEEMDRRTAEENQ